MKKMHFRCTSEAILWIIENVLDGIFLSPDLWISASLIRSYPATEGDRQHNFNTSTSADES